MKILISNDDGIQAPGIAELTKAFAQKGHQVVVCAPNGQRSAFSHSLTIGRPISVEEVNLPYAQKAYSIGGTPADCVKLGLMVLEQDCEAVISGVNCGYNVGTDVLYSGTVAAAMEGAINGRPALAISQTHTRTDYTQAAALAVELFERMGQYPLDKISMLNVNYPDCDEIQGILPAQTESLYYDEAYTPSVKNGVKVYTLDGVVREDVKQTDDYEKLMKGYATYTVLHADLTGKPSTDAWKTEL